MSEPVLQLDHVGKRLGGHSFAFDLRFEGPGLVAILGPSGSGKTTLFNLIAGYETPDSGRVLMAGQDMTRVFPGNRPVSLIFQDNNLFGHLSVADNVGLGLSAALKLSGEDRERVEAALNDVGLAGFGPRMPGQLSGGERQRVAFARASLRNRPILMLDEPFAALDGDLREAMGSLLTRFQARTGCLVLLITHDEAEAARLCQRTIRLAQGRVTSDTSV